MGITQRVDAITGIPPQYLCEAPPAPNMDFALFQRVTRFDVGDLTTQSFMDIWHGEPMRRIRRAQLRTRTEGPQALAGTQCDVCVAYG